MGEGSLAGVWPSGPGVGMKSLEANLRQNVAGSGARPSGQGSPTAWNTNRISFETTERYGQLQRGVLAAKSAPIF